MSASLLPRRASCARTSRAAGSLEDSRGRFRGAFTRRSGKAQAQHAGDGGDLSVERSLLAMRHLSTQGGAAKQRQVSSDPVRDPPQQSLGAAGLPNVWAALGRMNTQSYVGCFVGFHIGR